MSRKLKKCPKQAGVFKTFENILKELDIELGNQK